MVVDNQPKQLPDKPKRHGAEHLLQYSWKPGQSGNPKGRPKGDDSWRELIKTSGNKLVTSIGSMKAAAVAMGYGPDQIDKMKVKELLADALFVNGLKGKSVPLVQIQKVMQGWLLPGRISDMVTTEGLDAAAAEREKSIVFWEAVLDSEDAAISDRVKARQSLDILHGLIEADTTTPDEHAEAIRRAVDKMRNSIPDCGDSPDGEGTVGDD